MQADDLDAVMRIERQAYSVPWSRAHFMDSLAAGHEAWVLDFEGHMLGYCVAMRGVDEWHLLNLTVDPDQQGRGHGRDLLARVCGQARLAGMMQLWLEVRQSNVRAQALYLKKGFLQVGLRRGYYPMPPGVGGRENAVVMTLDWRDEGRQRGVE